MSDFRDYKIVLLGPIAVGKTSIINRFCSGDFIAKTKSTVGAGFYSKLLTIDDTEVTLMIWDTAGDERFKAVTPSLLHGANGYVLVYDLTSPQSFQLLHSYLEMIRQNTDTASGIPILVMGNKKDVNENMVSKDEVANWMKENGLELFEEVSAKTGENIDVGFNKLVSYLLKVKIDAVPKTIPLINAKEQTKTNEQKKCC